MYTPVYRSMDVCIYNYIIMEGKETESGGLLLNNSVNTYIRAVYSHKSERREGREACVYHGIQ